MDVPQLTDEEMAEIKKDVLLKLRPYLCDKIRAERHFDFLRSRLILTKDDTEEMNCRRTQRLRTGMLLDIIAENPRGLDTLLLSIQQSRSQNFLITKITDEVQKAKNEKLDALRASSSSFDATPNTAGATSGFPGTFSNESTMLFHPDGEGSPSTSDILGPLSLPSGLSKGKEAPSCGGSSIAVSPSSFSTTSASSLPKPGDPGAPPLPDELLEEPSPSSPESGAHGCASGGGDANFQPLRSRSLTPTSQRDIWSYPLSK